MLSITLPDGSVRQYEGPLSVGDIAASIGAGLAKAALAGKVDDKLVDLSHVVETDAKVAIITAKDPEALELIRHSTSHLMAQAVKELYPTAEVTIGPAIENGFYYDFKFERAFTPEDLEKIEARMKELVKKDIPLERYTLPRDEAIDYFKSIGEHYKAEIISEIPAGEIISLYRQGDFTDLCRGPHVPSTGKLKVFKLMKVAGAYWRGDSKNEMLQRIYGTAWAKKEDQEAYLTMLAEAENLLACQGLDAVAGRRTVHAPHLSRKWLPGSEGAAAARSFTLGTFRSLGQVSQQHVHDRIGKPLLRVEADELPGAHPAL